MSFFFVGTDGSGGGGSATYKEPVRAASIADVDIATLNAGDTLDGVVLVAGDRVLLKNQTAGAENGIYDIGTSGPATRSSDFDSDAEVVASVVIPVEEGTVNDDTGWLLATNNPIIVDTTALVFINVFAGAGIAGSGTLNTIPKFTPDGSTLGDSNITDNGVVVAIGQTVQTSGSPSAFTVTPAAHTTLTASAEATDINLNMARTVQFATGALTTQRAMRVQAPTYGFVGASVITTASTLSVSGAPIAGTNATITDGYALHVESGYSRFDGGITSPGAPGIAAFNEVSGNLAGASLAAGATENTYGGYSCGTTNITGDQDTGYGAFALQFSVVGFNVGVGFEAGKNITSSFNNVIVGHGAGGGIVSSAGGNNVCVGSGANVTNDGNNCVVFGGAGAISDDQMVADVADVYLAEIQQNSLQPLVFHGCAALNTDSAGSTVTLAGGISKGSGAGGQVIIQTSDTGAAAATFNVLKNVMVFNASPASAVNYFSITSAITAEAPILESTGPGTSVPLTIQGKGVGGHVILQPTNSRRVGIGTLTPDHELEVSTSGALTTVAITSNVDSPSAGGQLLLRHARGTESARTAILENDEVGSILFKGYETSFQTRARIVGFAAENFVGSAQGMRLVFGTAPIGSSTVNNHFIFDENQTFKLGVTVANWASAAFSVDAAVDVIETTTGRNWYNMSSSRSNAATKTGGIGTHHYTNAEEPFIALMWQSNATRNTIVVGSSTLITSNTANRIDFHTAVSNIDTSEPLRARCEDVGNWTFTQGPQTGGSPSHFAITSGAHLDLANAETTDFNLDFARTVNFVGGGGAISNQRVMRVQNPTYTADAAQTITQATTFQIEGPPIASTNITITTAYALNVNSGNSRFAGNIELVDNLLVRPVIKDYGMTTVTVGSAGATETLDLTNGNVFDITMDFDTNCTFTFLNPPASGTYGKIILILRGSGTASPVWPASVDWPNSVEPTYATPTTYAFITIDGGTTWLGMLGGSAFG